MKPESRRALVWAVLGIVAAVAGTLLFVLHGYPRWSTAPQAQWRGTDYLSWLASPMLWLVSLLLFSEAWTARVAGRRREP